MENINRYRLVLFILVIFALVGAFRSDSATAASKSKTVTAALNPPPANPMAYVTNPDALLAIDTATNTVAASISVNTGDVAVSPDYSRVYVGNSPQNTISVVSTATNSVVATIAFGGFNSHFSIAPDGTRIYVSNYYSNNVTVIDTATNQATATISVGNSPSSLAVTPDGSRVYVTNYGSNTVSVINTATNTVTATITGINQPGSIRVLPNGSRAYVVSDLCCVKVIDMASNTIVNSISVPDVPGSLTIAPNGQRAYLTHSVPGGPVSIINTSTETVTGNLPISAYPGQAAVTPDSSRVYVTGTASGLVTVADAATNTIITSVSVGPGGDGNGPYGIAITPVPLPPTNPTTIIDPQAYTGKYILYNTDTNTNLGTFSGAQTLNLVAGNYQFDNFNQVGTSAFNFSVNQFGQVMSVSNPNAAQGIGNTLRLNNTTINVNPQAYTGRYYFVERTVQYTGTQTFTVIPGLRYGIDSGAGIGGANGQSYFYFDVGANGTVSNIDVPAAAYGNGNTLYFNNKTLIIEPNGYTGNYNLSTHYTLAPYVSGRQSFVMIPGLLYAFDAGTGFFEQRFKLDSNGSPTNISPSGFAAGINNILVLANVSVHVDPTNYGGNYRLNDRIFSGTQNLLLIPNMRFYVAVNNSVGYFTPTNTQVTPPSVTLNDGGNNYTFNFFINQSCPTQLPGLISEWRGEGNALDSAGANHGTLQGGTTYTTGKVGQGFKFQDFFNDWVRVDSQVYEMQGGTVSTWFNWDGNEPANWFSANVILGSWQGGETSSPTPFVYFGTLWWQFSDTIYYGARYNTGIPIVPGRWYHIAMTYDNNYLVKLYLNGVLVDSGNLANPGDFRNEFGIGRGAGVTAVGIGGVIDETQIYNRPLSDCEVRNLYNSANGLPCEVCDNIAPTTTAARNPNANDAGWNNSNVTVSLSAADTTNGTGVSSITYSASGAQTVPQTVVNGLSASLAITAEGETTVTYFATDNAGNVETAQTLVVKIDKTAPVISAIRTPPANAAGWNKENVTASYTASDALSGLAVNSPETGSHIFTGEGANQTHTFTLTDLAGNSAAATVENVNIDTTAPQFTSFPGDRTLAATGESGANALWTQPMTSDNLSGNVTVVCSPASGSAFAIGSTTVTCTATDAAGNYTTRTFTISVTKAPSNITVSAPALMANGGTTTVSGVLTDAGNSPIVNRTILFSIGSGATAQTCNAATDPSGQANCNIANISQTVGPNLPVVANFAGDNTYLASTATTTTLVFAYATTTGGSFVVGDQSTVLGGTVMFSGSQWANNNSLSGGSAPDSFKGFASQPNSNPISCGGTWETSPGNNFNPPLAIPDYMAVIVSSLITKNGSTISGNTLKVAVVRTNSGDAGTGTVVGILCP